jgi:hypothetical protein
MRAGRDGGAGADRREELADRLDVVAEELGDLALESLRAALERGDTSRPADEKRLTQARRAVEKAAHLLRDIDARRTEGPTSSDDIDGPTGSDDGTADG